MYTTMVTLCLFYMFRIFVTTANSQTGLRRRKREGIMKNSVILDTYSIWKFIADEPNRLKNSEQFSNNNNVFSAIIKINFFRQDYHAILIYAPGGRAIVYDLDSSLPFPTHFRKYATETFRSDEALRLEYHRRFRLVPASAYLQHFASNRHHMKREDGTWIKSPPEHPPISTISMRILFK